MAQQEKKSLVKELIDLGKQKGSLTNQDILDALGEGDFDPEKLEKLYEALEAQGIEIIEDMGERPCCMEPVGLRSLDHDSWSDISSYICSCSKGRLITSTPRERSSSSLSLERK